MKKPIYFDHNATTPILPEVIEMVASLMHSHDYGNPSSVHFFGRNARALLDKARNALLDVLGLSREQYRVIFTSGGTEANNMLLQGMKAIGSTLITTTVEHPSILKVGPPDFLIGVSHNGLIQLNELSAALQSMRSKSSCTLSFALANSEVGVIQPVGEIIKMIDKEVGDGLYSRPIIHLDASQAVGKIPCCFRNYNLDAITISGHKFGAMPGVGALILRQSSNMKPLVYGGGQEFNLRPGTQNHIAIHSLAIACAGMSYRLEQMHEVEKLRDYLEHYLERADAPRKINILGKNAIRLPNTSAITVEGYDASVHVARLDWNNIAISAGSACSAGVQEPRYVPLAMGYSPEEAKTVIRISLGPSNTAAEIDALISAWQDMGV